MKLIKNGEGFFLEEKGQRIGLTSSELTQFRQMTPMGRKVTLRKRAVDRMAENPGDEEAQLILSLFKLPAHEWTFSIPD